MENIQVNSQFVGHGIRQANIFSSRAQLERTIAMAALAQLIYGDFQNVHEVSQLFPYGLTVMPTPADMQIHLPVGLRVQAYRHHEEVIIAIRGTELKKDSSTKLANLIADAGIGRHKDDDDLIGSVKQTNARAQQRYGYGLNTTLLDTAESVIRGRVKGHTDLARVGQMAMRSVQALRRGASRGGLAGALLSGGLVATGLLGGLVAMPTGLALVGITTLSAAATGGGVNATVEAVKNHSTMDGYPTLQAYIRAIDAYIMKLKEERLITEGDSIVTCGHSLAGYLSNVIGVMHADEMYSFNGPSLLREEEMDHIIYNLGLDRTVNDTVSCFPISMEMDFIGNLGRRDCGHHKLVIPVTGESEEDGIPSCAYESPLSHHGIGLMVAVLKNSTVLEVPHTRVQVLEEEEETV